MKHGAGIERGDSLYLDGSEVYCYTGHKSLSGFRDPDGQGRKFTCIFPHIRESCTIWIMSIMLVSVVWLKDQLRCW